MITHVEEVKKGTIGSDQLDDLFLNQLQQNGTCSIPILWHRPWNAQVSINDATEYANHLAAILACDIVTAVVWNHLIVRVVN